MNDNEIVQKMIEFIEEKENEIQENRLIDDNKAKVTAVNAILGELEKCIKNED